MDSVGLKKMYIYLGTNGEGESMGTVEGEGVDSGFDQNAYLHVWNFHNKNKRKNILVIY